MKTQIVSTTAEIRDGYVYLKLEGLNSTVAISMSTWRELNRDVTAHIEDTVLAALDKRLTHVPLWQCLSREGKIDILDRIGEGYPIDEYHGEDVKAIKEAFVIGDDDTVGSFIASAGGEA